MHVISAGLGRGCRLLYTGVPPRPQGHEEAEQRGVQDHCQGLCCGHAPHRPHRIPHPDGHDCIHVSEGMIPMADDQHKKEETEHEEPFEDNPFEEEPEEETHAQVEDLPEEKPAEEPEPHEEDEDILLPLDDETSEENAPPEKEEFSMPSEEEKAPPAKEAAPDVSDEEILLDEFGEEEEEEKAAPEEEPVGPFNSQIFILRTTANREEQVLDFLTSNASKKGLEVFSVI